MVEKQKFIVKQGSKYPVWAIVFLLIVILIAVWLYIFNSKLNKDIKEKNNEIKIVEIKLKELKNNKNLQVYNLLKANENTIFELEKRNQITKYIKKLNYIWETYWVIFSGFNFEWWELKTSAVVKAELWDEIAYQKTVNFIKKYRENKNSTFNLDFINFFDWNDYIKFNTTFSLK